MRPLSVGDVVSAGFRLYRSNLKSYLSIAFIAALWPLAGLMGLGLGLTIPAALVVTGGGALGGLVGVATVLGSLAFMAFCAAKSGMNTAVIARLAFAELTNQPESVATARHHLRPHLWQFLKVQAWLVLALLATQLVTATVQAMVVGIVVAVVQVGSIVSLLSLGLSLAGTAVYYWVLARLFLPDIALAMEAPDVEALSALGRSWKLSQGSAFRVSLVILVASLVSIPFFILAIVPLGIAALTVMPALVNGGGGEVLGPALIARLVPGLVVSLVLFVVANLSLMSFWQAIKAVIYYDLRNRQEGLDLTLGQDGDEAAEDDYSSPRRQARSAVSPRMGTATSGGTAASPSPRSRGAKPVSAADQQWAAAIAALNAGTAYQAPPPTGTGDDDEDEQPTIVASGPPVFGPGSSLSSFPDRDMDRPAQPNISPQAEAIADSISQLGGLYQMTGTDFEEVNAYLMGRSNLPPDQRKQASLSLARRLKATINLGQLPQKMTPELFLEALYLAYKART